MIQLLKQYPDLDAAKADMEHLYRRCFNQEVYTDSKLYNLLSNMSREVEDFLVVRTVLENRESPEAAYLRRELLIKALKKRSAHELLLKEAQNLIDEIQSSPLKSAEDYLSLHQIHYLLYFNMDTPKYIEQPISLLAAVENIDAYHRIQKLRFVAEMKARERIFGIPFNDPHITPFLEQAEAAGPTPLSATYCSLIRLFLHDFKEAEFKHVKTVFLDSFPLLPKMDQLNLFLHLVNCGISLSAKDRAVEEDMLVLYKRLLTKISC